jgi:hypothetical protein
MASNVQYFAQTVQTQTDGNSQQWKQAYDWGNHTVPGYITGLIDDNTPILGGNLNISSYNIIGTGNIHISGNITTSSGNFNQIVFNTSLAYPDLSQGQIQWNSTEGTLDLGLSDNYAMHIGEELLYRVRNNTGSTLLAGTAVYATGLTPGGNNRIEVAPKAADGSIREIRFMGLMTADCNTGLNGYTTHFGYIRGIDTRGDATSNGTTNKLWASGEPVWPEGDILYVHPTVAGKLTKIEPKHSISVAIILNRHQNQGKIFVRPTSYGHLDDNHDVSFIGINHNDVLVYNSGTDYWENNNTVIFSDINNMTEATGVNNIVTISQNGYNNLAISSGGPGYDPNTLYFIV